MLELRRCGCKTIVGVLDLLPELRCEGGEAMTDMYEIIQCASIVFLSAAVILTCLGARR